MFWPVFSTARVVRWFLSKNGVTFWASFTMVRVTCVDFWRKTGWAIFLGNFFTNSPGHPDLLLPLQPFSSIFLARWVHARFPEFIFKRRKQTWPRPRYPLQILVVLQSFYNAGVVTRDRGIGSGDSLVTGQAKLSYDQFRTYLIRPYIYVQHTSLSRDV
jgi:hypothetical protein